MINRKTSLRIIPINPKIKHLTKNYFRNLPRKSTGRFRRKTHRKNRVFLSGLRITGLAWVAVHRSRLTENRYWDRQTWRIEPMEGSGRTSSPGSDGFGSRVQAPELMAFSPWVCRKSHHRRSLVSPASPSSPTGRSGPIFPISPPLRSVSLSLRLSSLSQHLSDLSLYLSSLSLPQSLNVTLSLGGSAQPRRTRKKE
jgi:hypothetical protein